MAEPIKSALLVDYESLNRSLTGADGVGDARLADRATAWLGAIESGRLIGPEGTRRKLVQKRCYAGPSVRGKQRDALANAGFDVIDAANDGGARGAADMHMAIDAIDALSRPNGAEEFILLTAGSELAPLLSRMKASKRMTAIYADATTADSDRALADTILDSVDFAMFLTSNESPFSGGKIDTGSNAAAPTDRADIEAFARKIHAATSIPLFSPKTFAELFGHLTEEIKENGYHFQTTAKNVADRMTATGRNVTRRQVVFIVKGLALKGHVFSTSDTPERLAEVFREQAHYLIVNAGITLDENQERLLSAWFLSRAIPKAAPPKARAPSAEASNGAKPAARSPEKINPPAPQRPTASARPPEPRVKPVELPKSAAKPVPQVRPGPSAAAREEAKAVIAARIAASAKMKAGTRAPIPAKAAPKPPAARLAPAQSRTAAPADRSEEADRMSQQSSDALENSILAAIAEAVDVLVEDSDDARPSRQPPPKKKTSATGPTPPPPSPEASDGDDESGDIGDQIQRIIASYTRNRTE